MLGLPLWLFSRVLPVLALFGAVTWGVHTYNGKVSAAAVKVALADERAKTEPIFKELTANFNTLKGTFDNITAASNAERARRKAEIDTHRPQFAGQ